MPNTRLVCGARRAGKTHTLVEAAKKTGATIMCVYAVERDRIISEYGYDRVICFSQLGRIRVPPGSPLFVDNADMWMQSMLHSSGYSLYKYTVSDNPQILPLPVPLREADKAFKNLYFGQWINEDT